MLFDIVENSLVEQFTGRRFGRQRNAENLQDLVSRAFQTHVMLGYRHRAVGSDGCTNLYADSILGSTPEFLNLEVLLEPLEEQLCLPSVLIEVGYLQGCQIHCIGQKHELPALLFIVKPYKTQVSGIVLAALIDSQFNLCICENVLWQAPFPFDTLVL